MDTDKSYKGLMVWQKAHAFTLAIYGMSKSLPSDEKFGLISQIRRATVSIELNIVEGKFRRTNKDFARFLHISRASNQEVNCILLICKDLGYISATDYEKLTIFSNEISKMLNGLIKSIS